MGIAPKIAFIGAGSTIFMKNIVGDVLLREPFARTRLALMDINPQRLHESKIIAQKMVQSLGLEVQITTHDQYDSAVEGADFVVCAFQVGGYDPCTITDFEIPKSFNLEQTIGDTLGIGGIMRALRTVPHLWSLCDAVSRLAPDALLLQYVNPMVINCWAIAEKYPSIRQVGLCHSVQHTLSDLAHDLDLEPRDIRYRCAGINHMAYFLELSHLDSDGKAVDLYPELKRRYLAGSSPKPNRYLERCPNYVRYDHLMKFGYFVTESSEHFAEYVPWYIKQGRSDLIDKFQIPLDEYPKRCVEQISSWERDYQELKGQSSIDIKSSDEYAATIMNSLWTGETGMIYGNIQNHGVIASLPSQAIVEVPCLTDHNGIQPTRIPDLPPQLGALMRTNLNVQELTVAALMNECKEHVYHAAMLDPRTAAQLDCDQIIQLVDSLIKRHGDWLPAWLH